MYSKRYFYVFKCLHKPEFKLRMYILFLCEITCFDMIVIFLLVCALPWRFMNFPLCLVERSCGQLLLAWTKVLFCLLKDFELLLWVVQILSVFFSCFLKDDNLWGIHPAEWGSWWSTFYLECLAFESIRNNTSRCTTWLSVSTIKGATRSDGVQCKGICVDKYQT